MRLPLPKPRFEHAEPLVQGWNVLSGIAIEDVDLSMRHCPFSSST